MGTYYLVANATKREWLGAPSPDHPDTDWKLHTLVYGPPGQLLAVMLAIGPWSGDAIEVVADHGGRFEAIRDEWRDVTADALRLAAEWGVPAHGPDR